MNPRRSNQRNHALTRVEVLVVIITLGLLAILVVYSMAGAYRKFLVVECGSNVRQVALDYRVWADEHGGKFSMAMLGGSPDSMGLVVWTNYTTLSNEFGTPKILHCPADQNRSIATDFSTGFGARNVSYFTGLIADTNSPNAFLCGDDTFEKDKKTVNPGLLEFTANTSLHWSSARHHYTGNIALADGSVWEGVNHSNLLKLVSQTGLATNRLVVP